MTKKELSNKLARSNELLDEFVSLVEWWAPKDGTPRTAEALEFLGRPPAQAGESP